MKVDDALRGVTRLGLDTAPVIYFVEANPRYDAVVTAIFQRFVDGRCRGITSVVTLSEVLVRPLALSDQSAQAMYVGVLRDEEGLDVRSIDAPTAVQAASLRARHRLSLPNALQVSAALQAGCQAFLTNDLRLKRVTELRVLVLDELEL